MAKVYPVPSRIHCHDRDYRVFRKCPLSHGHQQRTAPSARFINEIEDIIF